MLADSLQLLPTCGLQIDSDAYMRLGVNLFIRIANANTLDAKRSI